MGIFDRFRRDEPDDPIDPTRRAELKQQLHAALDEALHTVREPEPPDRDAAELRARAYALNDQIAAAEQRENTPAAMAGYDVADDVMLSEVRPGPSSTDLQDDLGLLILSRPEAFTGTPLEFSEQHLTQMRTELLDQQPDATPDATPDHSEVDDDEPEA